ncbi:hypothetical protein F3Y22_tig00113719pilonHSYRG00028 [Hibiscus syriacus]|uniref:BED-type domain-containing protein n=1 Tax=Hibiscus syriacus TaxID=106335 RepID=A0A6A2WNP4_HIBSY|nr:zinc finger BED domain-containing protein DAYSLEEPER-like isoform X2 [Hibiscus syriacus]XP_039046454.1 zinc finger BED domain-containing protein DAYSLEEPER-like isoform X2 [Hibiscus syriacus]KAE8662093.1 hypothetical protein F3Y22_tig00113719pilonHSYRG00028 [Hibiscus syriacus]
MDWSMNNAFKTYKDMQPRTMMDLGLISNIDPIDIELDSSEKGNIASTSKPRKKTLTSVYLKYFETAPDGKTRRCKFCGQSYSIATATGNLGRHLNNRHPGYDKIGENVASPAPSPATTVIKKSQPQGRAPQVDYDHLNWLLIKWLVLATLPPSTLEDKWLSSSFKFLNPSIQLWPGEKYKAVFREVFRSMREDVRVSLEQVSSKVSVTLDFWTSYEQIFYMSITCHWIDENWSFRKVLLDICQVLYPCTGSEIYNSLVKVLRMYNIENKVLSCTHDNSQNAIRACHSLEENINGHKVGPFCYIPCTSCTLSSIIDDALRMAKPIISKIREFVQEMNASVDTSEEFIQLATAYQEGSWQFPLDASARWSGNYQMLDLVHKAGKSMDAVVRKNEDMLGSGMLLNAAEKNVINIVHDYLEPFYKVINEICVNKYPPTIGMIIVYMDHISDTIATRQPPDWLKNSSEEMFKKLRSYNDQVCNMFIYMTAILDPRIKCELIPESLNLENYLEEARAHFIRNYCSNNFSSMTSGYSAQDIDNGASVSFAEEIARKKRRASMNNATDELTQYLSESPAPTKTDVLEWWKVNSTRYPRLSTMARDFLAVQATSVKPEELFCNKGDEIDKQRYCMPHDSTQAILCIKSWVEGGLKLKYKSTEIDYERLMELAAAATTTNSPTGTVKRQK